MTYTVMSKRRFIDLVNGGYVNGYDDPRLPTLAGLRRRGYTPEAIHEFCDTIGVAKTDSTVDVAVLEDCVRNDLNKRSQRVMAVMNPIKVVLTNYPEDQVEELDVINNPEDPDAGTRKVPFARELYIERDDFREDPPPKFYRLAPGREVRLRNAYFIKCENVVKDASGEIVELHCTYDPETRGGDAPDGRKVKATLHWVAAKQAIEAEARLYDHLFLKPNPDDVEPGQTFRGQPEPGLAARGHVLRRAERRRGRARHPLSVRASGVFLRGHRLDSEEAGVQPHGHPARLLGEDREGAEGREVGTCKRAKARARGAQLCAAAYWTAPSFSDTSSIRECYMGCQTKRVCCDEFTPEDSGGGGEDLIC